MLIKNYRHRILHQTSAAFTDILRKGLYELTRSETFVVEKNTELLQSSQTESSHHHGYQDREEVPRLKGKAEKWSR